MKRLSWCSLWRDSFLFRVDALEKCRLAHHARAPDEQCSASSPKVVRARTRVLRRPSHFSNRQVADGGNFSPLPLSARALVCFRSSAQ